MNILRRASTRQLLIAIVAVDRGRRPAAPSRSRAAAAPSRPTARWQRRSTTPRPAKPVQGVTARVQFTDHLIPSGSLGSSSPLITGATGRVWAGSGKLRLELQSSAGDTEIGFDGSKVDGLRRRRRAPPTRWPSRGTSMARERPRPPRGAERRRDPARALAKLSQHVDLSGAIAGDIAGQPSYTVRVSPRHSGGLLGSVQLAWDATHGVPLRIAVYSRTDSSPVLVARGDRHQLRRGARVRPGGAAGAGDEGRPRCTCRPIRRTPPG